MPEYKESFVLTELSGCLNLVFSPSTASHVSFADKLVSIWNKHCINFRAIGHIKIASPSTNYIPQRFKPFSTLGLLIPILEYLVSSGLLLSTPRCKFFLIRQRFVAHLVLLLLELSLDRQRMVAVFQLA